MPRYVSRSGFDDTPIGKGGEEDVSPMFYKSIDCVRVIVRVSRYSFLLSRLHDLYHSLVCD